MPDILEKLIYIRALNDLNAVSSKQMGVGIVRADVDEGGDFGQLKVPLPRSTTLTARSTKYLTEAKT